MASSRRLILKLFTLACATRASEWQSSVVWDACGDNYECTRISAPLDWSNATDTRNVSLAVGRYLATSKPYLGSIWYNPGGPGESGSAKIYSIGPLLNAITNGQFDIISRDPRGVNASSPNITCFDTGLDEHLFRISGVGSHCLDLPVNFNGNASVATPAAIAEGLEAELTSKKASLGSLFKQCVEKSGEIVPFIGTEFTVKDLDYMSKLISGENERINYYGVSYGTIIGQYMMTILKPERLGKIVIDGVENANYWQDYAQRQLTNPPSGDLDATLLYGFATHCAAAGSDCALSSLGTASNIIAAIHGLIDSFYFNPATTLPSVFAPGVIGAQYARYMLYEAAFAPSVWVLAAEVFALALAGDYSLLVVAATPYVASLTAAASSSATFTYSQLAVMYADWKPYDHEVKAPSIKTVTQLVLHNLKTQSASLGDSLYDLVFSELWPSESLSRYSGTLKLKKKALDTPVLILTNTLDPITPISGALTALANFGSSNARLVEQNGTAHTTLSQTGTCVQKITAAYFLNGTLPETAHSHCILASLPFADYV